MRQNHNEIAELCRSSGESANLTQNSESDLVVMDIESYTRREKMLDLHMKLLEVERDCINGAKYFMLDVEQELDETIAATERDNPCIYRGTQSNCRDSPQNSAKQPWPVDYCLYKECHLIDCFSSRKTNGFARLLQGMINLISLFLLLCIWLLL